MIFGKISRFFLAKQNHILNWIIISIHFKVHERQTTITKVLWGIRLLKIVTSISENSEVHKSATLQQNGPSRHSSAWLWPWKWYEHEAEYVHFSKPRRSRRENVFISSKAAFCWKLAFLCLFAWKNDDVVKELCWKVKSELWCRCNLSIMAKAIQHVIAPFFNYWLWNSKIHWQYQFSNFKVNFENNRFEQICILTTSIDIREAFWFQIEHLTKRLRWLKMRLE